MNVEARSFVTGKERNLCRPLRHCVIPRSIVALNKASKYSALYVNWFVVYVYIVIDLTVI